MTTHRSGGGPSRPPGGSPGSRPGGPQPGGEPDFWSSYLKDGYFDAAGNLHPRLVVEDAIEMARRLARGRTGGRDGFAPAQLRRFYGKAKFLEQKLEAGTPFASLVAELLTLQPLAADAVAKEKAPSEFKQFIDKNLHWAARDQKSFKEGFLVHFQSVVAYFNFEKKGGGR